MPAVRVQLGEEARADLLEAVEYHQVEARLGAEFLAAVAAVLVRIGQHPESGPLTGHRDVRHMHVARFKYTVFFRIQGDVAHVVAIAHQRRKPGHWRSRLKR